MKSYSRVVLHRRVIVNLLGGRAIEGIIWDELRDLLVLRGAVMHVPGATAPMPLDGEIVLERSRIDFVQVTG